MSVRAALRAATVMGFIGCATQPAAAFTVLEPDAVVAGKPLADWTAAWWTWAVQAPASTNPLLDKTGAFANVDNNGPVFFVAGNLSGTATRHFTAPIGKPILFPLVNTFDVESVPPDDPGMSLADREAAAETFVANWLSGVDTGSLFASIDGAAITNPSHYLEVTGSFSMGPSQPGSLLEAIGLPAGTDASPAKSGGYWLMIDGLSPGPHELHFGASSHSSGQNFSTETTASINVVPIPPALPLIGSALAALVLVRRRRVGPRQGAK